MLSEESRLNFLMKYGDSTTEIKLATYQRQKPTEMITQIRWNLHLFQDSVFWGNGSQIGRLDTIFQLKSSSTMKDLSSNWTILPWNLRLKKSLLKTIISKSFFLKEPQMLKSQLGINKLLLQEFKRALDTLISLEDQHSCSKITKVNWKRKISQLNMN